MNIKHLLAAAAALAFCAASHAQVAPINNPDAEANAIPFFDNFDANVLGLNAVPAGWTIASGTVDIIGSNFSGTSFDLLPGHGAYIDLDGSTGAAGLQSTLFTLTAGVQYIASFDLAGSQRGSTETGTVTFGGASLNYNIASNVGFTGYSLSFTPTTTGLYGLSFQNAGGDNVGALLDNVGVNVAAVPAVPEPGTYALMAGGLLAIGFIARRRKSAR